MLKALKIAAYFLSVLFVLTAPATAQSVREHEIGVRAFAFHDNAARKIKSYEASADARSTVGAIMSRVGLPMNLDVRAAPNVSNAEALVEKVDGKEVRVILYNPAWMENLKTTLASNWPSVSIMAHEIGHHLAGHLDPAYANHPAELEADKFSGFILNRLGASLAEAQNAMLLISPGEDSVSHPGRVKRVLEITRGWNEASAGQGANVIKSSPPVSSGQRVALLIGNTNYKSEAKLKNPKNDVIAIQRELRKLGFSTTTLYDGTSEQMSEYVRLFREDVKGADWALFYFAGRGIEVDGINYMVPIDANEYLPTFTRDYPRMRLDTAFESVREAKVVRLVVADSCRIDPANLPDASNLTNASHVFRVVEPPSGIVVAYSTRAGTYASDGEEDLSPYAQALIKALREPGIELDRVFRRVNAQVAEVTQGRQEPSVLGTWPAQDLHLANK